MQSDVYIQTYELHTKHVNEIIRIAMHIIIINIVGCACHSVVCIQERMRLMPWNRHKIE